MYFLKKLALNIDLYLELRSKYPTLKKLGGYKDILTQAPLPVTKSIAAGPDHSTLGWVICPNNKLIMVRRTHFYSNSEDVVGPIYDIDPTSRIASLRENKTGRAPALSRSSSLSRTHHGSQGQGL